MQLTKTEMAATQMIVTTPEKWDVITRKGGDVAIASQVGSAAPALASRPSASSAPPLPAHASHVGGGAGPAAQALLQ
jgi:hypothetical protein